MQLPWRPVSIGDGPAISTSLTAAEAERLQELATDRLVLEVGAAYGFSAITMAETAIHVLSIDPHGGYGSLPDSLEHMRKNLAAYGADHYVTPMIATSATAMETLRLAGARFGLVFVDGDHRAEAVEADLAEGWALLESGGYLAVHDFGEDTCPDVQPAVLDFRDKANVLLPEITDTLWVAQKP